ncbi:MAG: efflux RND transporter permease subunit [Campylobacteraceae bacterium]|mgnify:CR=1|nr:efflux RND transporter permease subunit [Campylobacteraceae bacterium]MBT3882060.1 efflux RND transporter permease subunit [Campylobacteraceae bacterium]MBT4030231.1 efflux RND transporter permease subunit [Campylobacteraceae bacterium]MBT4179025.1 efflux RND transporter permease subunit [Campylobacteraceae bacterium]MBT4573070.1 efflux RND transporter permease subunit [Campylobacteraceae bacterium]
MSCSEEEIYKNDVLEAKKNSCHQNIAGKLAATFIKHPLTLILGLVILVLGYLSLELTPREENPQIKVAGGAVIVAMPGAKANEIQKVIIEPLEKKIREIKGIENIFSTARDNVGIVQVQYYIGEDKGISDLKLYDQIMKNMDALPKTAMQPIIKTMDIDTDIPVATIAFYSKSKTLTDTELFKKIDYIGHSISKINNVAKIDLKGEKKEQFNILVSLKKLKKYKMTLGQVAMTLKDITFELPDIKGAMQNNSFTVFGLDHGIRSVNDISNILIDSYDGKPVYVKDIATVALGSNIQDKKENILYSKLHYEDNLAQKSLTLTVSKLKGANTVVINKEVFAYFETIKDDLEANNIGYVITRDDGYTANHAVNELMFHLLISVVIIAILLIFALGFKEALIVSLTVPMILALTLFVGLMIGETINRITLFALLLSLGLLVDAAIIVIENIHRHMHSSHSEGKTIAQIAVEATNEIGNPTNVATIAIIMTFIPMFFVGGMMGQFMHPLPVFVPIALFMSLFVAYIFTPYLVNKLLKKKGH